MEDEKDPLFIPEHGLQINPKRLQKTLSGYEHSGIQGKFSSSTTGPPDHMQQILTPRGSDGDTNTLETSRDTTTTSLSSCISSSKAELMKGVHHAVQSSQHPSVKLRSPSGKSALTNHQS